jgi:imidazolonepropionase-like amidohydrolase
MNARGNVFYGVALWASCALGAASGLQAQVPAPRQSRPIALVGATIHPISSAAIEGGTLVFANGVITALGRNVQIPANAERIDVSGMHVYPGLVDAYSSMGLYEIGSVDMTVDTNEFGDINPSVRAEVAVNPESRHIGTSRSNGVLVSVTTPSGGLVAGLSAAMMLDGWTWEQMTLKAPAGLIVEWPGAGNEDTYSERIRQLRQVFANARAYQAARTASQNGTGPYHPSDSRWEAMIPVLDKQVPVVVGANEIRQIQDAIKWAEEEGVRLVLRGASDAGYIAEHLASKQIPVVLTEVIAGPERDWEPYDAAYSLPARLHRAGVKFAIAGSSSAPYENRLPYEAGAAVAFGLPEEEALKAVTLNAAEFLGIADRVGSLEVGKDATLLITTGSPIEYASTVERAFIQGRDIDLQDIHRQFFAKYMEKIAQTRANRPMIPE